MVQVGLTRRGKVNHLKGLAAEEQVCHLLERRGARLCARRWRGSAGEVDLVMREGETVVFVEVKAGYDHDAAMSHLTPGQIARIFQTADEYLANEPKGLLTEIRFDVALVDRFGRIDVVANALAG